MWHGVANVNHRKQKKRQNKKQMKNREKIQCVIYLHCYIREGMNDNKNELRITYDWSI